MRLVVTNVLFRTHGKSRLKGKLKVGKKPYKSVTYERSGWVLFTTPARALPDQRKTPEWDMKGRKRMI